MSCQTLDHLQLAHPEMLTKEKIMEILKGMNVPVSLEAALDKNALVDLCYKHIVPRPQRQPRGKKKEGIGIAKKPPSLVRPTGSVVRTIATPTRSESTISARKRPSLPENDALQCDGEQEGASKAPPAKKVMPVQLKRNTTLHAMLPSTKSSAQMPDLRQNKRNAAVTAPVTMVATTECLHPSENERTVQGLTKSNNSISPVRLKRSVHTVASASETDSAKANSSGATTPTPAKKKIKLISWP